MPLNQAGLHHLVNKIEMGEMTAAEANVEMVRMQGVRLVTNRLPKDVRAALMGAVKSGCLGRLVKDGRMPEAFFHPNSEIRAKEMRDAHVRKIANAVSKIAI